MLTVNNLETVFRLRKKTVYAVRGVSFSLKKGESIAIVGESGSGKSVLALSVMGLIRQPPGVISGSVDFSGVNIAASGEEHLRKLRGNRICMIFQDPLASFNPFLRIIDQMTEPLILHRGMSKKDAVECAVEVLASTGITDRQKIISSFPHEFSGGMLQRVMVAMSIMMKPDIIFADEPTTALDVTVQAQLIGVMKQLIVENNAAIVFITHNLALVNGFCNRIIVMYAGVILESGTADEVLFAPEHPYTRGLIRSVPTLTHGEKRLYTIPGEPPDSCTLFDGCPFFDRCEYAAPCCNEAPVILGEVQPEHFTACVRRLRREVSW